MLGTRYLRVLGRFGVVGGNKLFLHHVLDLLHGGDRFHLFQLCHNSLGQLVQLLVAHLLGGVAHVGLKDGAAYLGSVEGDLFPAALDDGFQHGMFLFP